MINLATERFYGAKSEAIDAIDVVARQDLGMVSWQLLDVTHGDATDRYQVVLNKTEEADVLATPEGATAYLAGADQLGDVHGHIGGSTARLMGAEQSNTSLIVDEKSVLKVFRKLEYGTNPDVELLSAIADCPHVAGVTGYVTRDGATLAMQQQLVFGGADGFELAVGDTLGDAAELGSAVRVVHDTLLEAFDSQRISGTELRHRLENHLDELVGRSPRLSAHESAIRRLYRSIDDGPFEIQRIHGDLHLGQTLKTITAADPRWYLIDFEGEPARPLEQRRAPDHVLRDVAGMVRSFGYARAVGGHTTHWEQMNTRAFLDGYGINNSAVLAAYVVDKAAYEVVYEENNRPDWVEIPLQAIEELI